MTLTEQDTGDSANATCTVRLPCTNTPYAYAPCWLKGKDANGDYDNTGAGEFRHGFYMMTYQIRDKYSMDEWGTCDTSSCIFNVFGEWGFFCKNTGPSAMMWAYSTSFTSLIMFEFYRYGNTDLK